MLAASTDTHGLMNGSNASFSVHHSSDAHRSTSLPLRTGTSPWIAVSLIQLQPWIIMGYIHPAFLYSKVRPAPGSSRPCWARAEGNDTGWLCATYNVAHDMPQRLPAPARDGSRHGDDASRPARTVTRGDVDITTWDQSNSARPCSRHEEFSAASDPSTNPPSTPPTYCSGREGRRGG